MTIYPGRLDTFYARYLIKSSILIKNTLINKKEWNQECQIKLIGRKRF